MTEMLKDKPGENIYNIYHSIWSAILKYIKNTINQQKTQCLGRKKKKDVTGQLMSEKLPQSIKT